jgi:hypothetical protein
MLANAKPSTTLFHAAQRGDLAAVQALLREPNTQVEIERALRVATRNGWHLVVQLLCGVVPRTHALSARALLAGGWGPTTLHIATCLVKQATYCDLSCEASRQRPDRRDTRQGVRRGPNRRTFAARQLQRFHRHGEATAECKNGC